MTGREKFELAWANFAPSFTSALRVRIRIVSVSDVEPNWFHKIWWHLSILTLAPEIEASLGVFVYDKNATSNGGPKNALNTHWSLF